MECAIPGFRIEPSQGTHFFQNITSLGVGYLTIDTVTDGTSLDSSFLGRLNCLEEGKYVRLYEAPESFVAYIDRRSNRAVAGIMKNGGHGVSGMNK